MEETRRLLYREKYPTGSLVNVAKRDILEDFVRTWKLHNKLQAEQLDYAEDWQDKVRWVLSRRRCVV
jgi:hypothetical protein